MELLARDFNRMLEDLAAIDTRVAFRDVVLGVAERVMKGALSGTKAADSGKILARFANKRFTTFGGKVYYLENRYPDVLWEQIDAMRRESLEAKINAVGLAKQSWQHVASSFGSQLAAPGYVAMANSRGRRYPEDGSSSESGGGSDFALTVKNSSPIAPAAGGGGALGRAMRGEIRYFARNIEKHAFATVESRVKKYPGVFARQSLAA
jgi:hypothetical protein